MSDFEFGDVLRFKKDWTLNYITFQKGDLVRVAFQDHKYGIELVHSQIRGVFEFRYEPHTKERMIKEYFEKVEQCEACICISGC